jgi:hypothetical protein
VLAATRELLERSLEVDEDEEAAEALHPELTRFLYELREYEESWVHVQAAARSLSRYRMSQALWASREELRPEGGRTAEVDPDVSFVVLPARDENPPVTPGGATDRP